MTDETISLAEVRHVARLARLGLSDDAAEAMRAELATILEYVRALDAVDTAGLDPSYHPFPVAAPLRDDAERPSLPREVALNQAPASNGEGFAVPAVLEGA